MKYYADYMKERIYAVDEEGTAICKIWDDKKKKVSISKSMIGSAGHPWYSWENSIGFLVEEMTQKEYESFGTDWLWAAFPDYPKEHEKHSWRNYMEKQR